jgi:hypothetical protein
MRLAATLIACAVPLAARNQGTEVRAENAAAAEVARGTTEERASLHDREWRR